MHGQDRGMASGVGLGDRAQHASRRAHPQAPPPPERHHLSESIGDERRHFDDRTGGRLAAMRIAAVVDTADDLERRHAGVDLKLPAAPVRRAPTSARSLIDHSGARNAVGRRHAGGGDARLNRRREVGGEFIAGVSS